MYCNLQRSSKAFCSSQLLRCQGGIHKLIVKKVKVMKAHVTRIKSVRGLKFSKKHTEYILEVNTPYGTVETREIRSTESPFEVGDEISVVVRSSLQRLVDRLERIGVSVGFACNAPWIYLETVNGVKVAEKRWSEHGYTVFFMPMKRGEHMKFTKRGEGRKEFFLLLRRYLEKPTSGGVQLVKFALVREHSVFKRPLL